MKNNFKQFNLEPYLLEAISELNFKEPTEIQTEVITNIQSNRDIIAQSKTGSGKTHAFLLPLLNQLGQNANNVQVVITAPSRELAEQLYQATIQLTKNAPWDIEVSRFIGGTDKNRQIESLQNSQPDVVIGTPGRLFDLIQSNELRTNSAYAMVVDEADMTLDLGFIEEVDKIASTLQSNSQLLVFSATIPQKLQPFLQKYMNQPIRIEIENKEVISDLIDNWLISTKSKERTEVIYNLLTIGNPYLVLIFANTKENVEKLANQLIDRGLNVGILHGGLDSRERRRVMREIHNLDYQFIVATDLAARGIDIEGVSHVINAEVPQDLSYFVHRVGRTGRNKLPGIAITLYSPGEEDEIQIIENMGISFEEKTIKNNEIVDAPEKRTERKRPAKPLEYDAEIAGLAKKSKKKVKPGYRRKIRSKRKELNKQKSRQKRKQNKRKK
ncbi:ATP-dependent RNA helicase CshB [Atopostipes suicloacalis DSM 15692]|uniref:DEAD-box ATP-dependent RNA helicase CshB n=1 Tax=Atopostipes suicloacalis DSM 15692 TaxID=1121025 RepID=A0A1M4Y262_9LACT|nr:DEAD/DEAH box helicase [Atopostipes suicloacalis]SHE99795.1 ATP-dependent RNA helicase CshB [Atopostipes suicloacalis DSM 15692]